MEYSLIGGILGDLAASSWHRRGAFRDDPRLSFSSNDKISVYGAAALAGRMALTPRYGGDFYAAYRAAIRRFPRMFPPSFSKWPGKNWDSIEGEDETVCMMRALCAGEKAENIDSAVSMAMDAFAITGEYSNGLYVETLAVCCYMACHGADKKDIWRWAERQIGEIPSVGETDSRWNNANGNRSVLKLALRCFIDSKNYNECINNVLATGCELNKVGCAAGALAGGFYKELPSSGLDVLPKILPAPLRKMLGV